MKQMTAKHWLKAAIAVLVLALATFLCLKFLLPLSHLLATEEGRQEICLRMEDYGIFAPLVFIGMMALQIVIAFIPGGPMELLAGMLFGGLRGTLWSVLGSMLGTVVVYALVKCFGRPLVQFFVSEKQLKRFTILEDEKKLEFWVFLLFLIPGIPKDLLTYIVPLTRMQLLHFLALTTIARFPAIVASVLIGDSFSDGRYWLCIVIACVAALAAFVGFRIKTGVLKEKR